MRLIIVCTRCEAAVADLANKADFCTCSEPDLSTGRTARGTGLAGPGRAGRIDPRRCIWSINFKIANTLSRAKGACVLEQIYCRLIGFTL